MHTHNTYYVCWLDFSRCDGCLVQGWIPDTGLMRNSFIRYLVPVLAPIIRVTSKMASTTQHTSLWMCKLVTGEVLPVPDGCYWSVDREHRSSELSYDERLQKDLWDMSSRFTRLGEELAV